MATSTFCSARVFPPLRSRFSRAVSNLSDTWRLASSAEPTVARTGSNRVCPCLKCACTAHSPQTQRPPRSPSCRLTGSCYSCFRPANACALGTLHDLPYQLHACWRRGSAGCIPACFSQHNACRYGCLCFLSFGAQAEWPILADIFVCRPGLGGLWPMTHIPHLFCTL